MQRNPTVCVMTPERMELASVGACRSSPMPGGRQLLLSNQRGARLIVLSSMGCAREAGDDATLLLTASFVRGWDHTGPACDRMKIDLPEVTVSKAAIQSLEAELDVSYPPTTAPVQWLKNTAALGFSEELFCRYCVGRGLARTLCGGR